MLAQKKTSPIKTLIFAIVIIIIWIGIIFLLYDYTAQPKNLTVNSWTVSNILSNLIKEKGINADFQDDFLVKNPYIRLKESQRLPIRIGEIGRANPFIEILYNF